MGFLVGCPGQALVEGTKTPELVPALDAGLRVGPVYFLS